MARVKAEPEPDHRDPPAHTRVPSAWAVARGCEIRCPLQSRDEISPGAACPSAGCGRCSRQRAAPQARPPPVPPESGTPRKVHCHECIPSSFPGSAARRCAMAACRSGTTPWPTERSAARASYSMLGLVFGPDPFLRRLLAACVSSLTPARHQSMLDPQLVENPRDNEVDQFGNACRMMIETWVSGQDYRTGMREPQHVFQMKRGQGRFARHQDERSFLLEHDVGGALDQVIG